MTRRDRRARLSGWPVHCGSRFTTCAPARRMGRSRTHVAASHPLGYPLDMRFGSRSHETSPLTAGGGVRDERDRLVAVLRGLADRIEAAPFARIRDQVSWIATALEPVVRVVERAVGGGQ